MERRGNTATTSALPLTDAERDENARRQAAVLQRGRVRKACAPHGDYDRVFSPRELIEARRHERALLGESD